MSETGKKSRNEPTAENLRAVLAALGAPKDDREWGRLLRHAESSAFREALALVRHWMTSFTVVTEVARIFRYHQDRGLRCLTEEPQLRCLTDEWLANAKNGEALIPLVATIPGLDTERQYKGETGKLEKYFSEKPGRGS